ncbi:MAG: hypothetical protein JWO97_1100 [Acidobacteria bacterium]|nr:hypothetical protein [Acidobacteriota bacterium]
MLAPSLVDFVSHLSEYAKSPRTIGAVAPSSRALADAMAESVTRLRRGDVVIELGSGTGSITKSIRTVWPSARVIAVEKNARMAAKLRGRFPDLDVIESCATGLGSELDALDIDRQRVAAVLSGLPLLSFGEKLRREVFAAIHDVLPRRGVFIQFTYSGRAWRNVQTPGFRLVSERRVIRNIPPATILCFEKHRG